MAQPLISIVVPNYNHAPYLRKRLDSVVSQTYQNTEIILLDDCSADNSLDILRSYNDTRIQLYPNRINSGSPFVQWNKGAELARGKYLWIAESDDYCESTLLENLVAILEKNDDVHLAFCQSVMIDENDNTLHSFAENYRFLYKTDRWEKDFIASGEDECREYLMCNNTIPNASAVLFRRETYLKVGGAPVHYRLNGDWMLYTKILAEGKFAFLSKPENYFRLHTNTQRHKARRTSHAFPEMLGIQDFIINRFNIPEKEITGARRQAAEWWVGGIAHQHWFRKGFWKENIRLYQTFSPYYSALWLRIIWHITYACGWYVLYLTGTLKAMKKIRRWLFPGKYFEH
jgi:glycosyltransferase involved in cell wall biosynthesis